jgi:hypothetical protein
MEVLINVVLTCVGGQPNCFAVELSSPRTGLPSLCCGVFQSPLMVRATSFKYRMAYVVNGECVLRYDNEVGKGDHRHWGRTEGKYPFSGPEKLIADFQADIERWDHENGDA